MDYNQAALTLTHFFWQAVDWVFPPSCASCGQKYDRWCPSCQSQVKLIPSSICKKCGSPIKSGSLCMQCRNTPPPYDALRSWGVYEGPLKTAIHQYKYENNLGLAELFAQKLIGLFSATLWTVDIVTSIPLSPIRMLERGYNQSSEIGRPLAQAVRLPFIPQAVKRVKHTHTQVGLSGADRLENLRGAFQANPKWVKNKVVLVVDDVITTGATMFTCAQALEEAGAQKVYGLSLARAGIELHQIQPQAAQYVAR